MKTSLTFLIISLVLFSCGNNENMATEKQNILIKNAIVDTANFTTVKWIDTLLAFDSIKQGEKITLKFKCINTGTKPLILTDVRPGCGCTIAEYSKGAILPGKEGWVTTNFDSKKFCGEVEKSVLVTSNSVNDNERTLKFSGTITNCISNDKIVLPNPALIEKNN